MTLGTAGGGAALVAVIIVFLVVIRANQSPATPAGVPGVSGVAPAPATPSIATSPTWWDVDLSVEMAAAESRPGSLAGATGLMKSESADERAAGYEQVIEAGRPHSET
jgi:hypothetical protein